MARIYSLISPQLWGVGKEMVGGWQGANTEANPKILGSIICHNDAV